MNSRRSEASASGPRPPISSIHRLASSSSAGVPGEANTAHNAQNENSFIPSASSTDLSLNASSSNYSIWPEDMSASTTNGHAQEPEAIDQDEEEILPMNGLSRMSLGDYHSARLAAHDRSDTSSPVSNSEEDEEDRVGQNRDRRTYTREFSHSRSEIAAVQAKNGRAVWNSNREEDFETAGDNEITFKSGWNTKDATLATSQEKDSDVEPGEGDEPAASRVPNEIIMHASHVQLLVMATY